MVDRSQIIQWVQQGESETLEFKKTTGERREAMHTLCAMLNHRGGKVLFGVSPAKQILGQQVSDRTVEELSEEIQRLDPPAFPTIERIDWEQDRQIILVSISIGPNRPYSYKGQAYRRVGNSSLEMSREEYNRVLFERMHGERRWENEVADEWEIADLDQAEIVSTLDEAIRRGRIDDPGSRDPEKILRGLGLLKDHGLMRAAVALFGRQQIIETRFQQGLLRLARFRGTDKTEFLDNRQVYGNIFHLLLKAQEFLRSHLPVASRVEPGLFDRVDEPVYPPIALREALANAFCHRDYSIGGGSVSVGVYDDRLEVTSSGTLHFGMTPEALFRPHDSLPWNPLIARVFFLRGLIEQWGRGTLKIAELMELAGLPRPEIEERGGAVTVRFLQRRLDLSLRQQQLLALLAPHPEGLSRSELLRNLPKHLAVDFGVRDDLQALKSMNLVVIQGHGRGAKWLLSPNRPN